MADMIFDFSEFTDYKDQLVKAVNSDELLNRMMPAMQESAQYLNDEIKERTPVDTGDLHRRWHVVGPQKFHRRLLVEVVNDLEYASFVENGHRQTPGRYIPALGKRLKAKWVEGAFMARDGTAAVEEVVNEHLQQAFDQAVQSIFG